MFAVHVSSVWGGLFSYLLRVPKSCPNLPPSLLPTCMFYDLLCRRKLKTVFVSFDTEYSLTRRCHIRTANQTDSY